MDSGDPTSIIIAKIRALDPENALKIIGYFLLQDIEKVELIRIAFGPDTLIQALLRKAKSCLGLPSNYFSVNPRSRTINIHDQSLPPSSPRNEFLDFSRNPNHPLSPSLIRDNPNFNSSPLNDGSYQQQQQQQLRYHFANLHKRGFSANDAYLESEEPGYQFLPGGLVDGFGSPGGFGSPSEQQRMIAAQFMADFGSPMSNRQGSGRHERKYSVSQKIYLTFPPESSFTEEDVSTYFSKFGAVEDIQIPYQKRQMYGFVTFANAETVRTILARGNPHFICDSTVLVKTYKEKGKILQKRQQLQLHQLLEGGNYSPSGLDSRELYDCRFGPRMFSNKTQEMLRRKTEQADLQEAIEVEHQRGRFLNLQFPDMENKSIHHHQRSPSIGSPAHFLSRIMEGDSDRGEKRLQQIETSNEEKPYDCRFGPRMFSNKTQEMLRRKPEQADLQQAIEVEHQRRRFSNLQFPDMENKSIHHHQHSPSIGSSAHFPSRVMEGDSDRGEKHLQQVETSDEERGYSNDFYKGQETSLENTLPDSLFGCETRQTESDTEQNKEASSDQSA